MIFHKLFHQSSTWYEYSAPDPMKEINQVDLHDSDMSLTNLIDGIGRGSTSAETTLTDMYYSPLKKFIHSRESDIDLVEEVVQDTWLVVIEKLRNKKLRDPSKFKSFLWSVGANQLLMAYRKRQHSKEQCSSVENLEDSERGPELAYFATQLRNEINETFKRLTKALTLLHFPRKVSGSHLGVVLGFDRHPLARQLAPQ